MKVFLFALIVNFIVAISSFAQTENPPKTKNESSDALAEARRAIERGNARWIEAWEKGDPAMIAELFTDDGKYLSGSGKVFKGRGQILEWQKSFMQALGKGAKVTVQTTHVWLDGDTAYETGKYGYAYQENGKPTSLEGKYVTIWKRQADGSWKLFMDMGVPQD